ncbi:MAG TPA: hypothetical protein VMT12_03620 [Syntrophales bacterium]|nr:hypothetical protein [Syntrophales bacterium]
MKRKKSINMAENIVDMKGIMDQKKINDLCGLDYDDFKLAMARLLLTMVKAMGENNKKIDASFKRLVKHLKIVSEELKFIKNVLYIERILNGEHRDGRMTMEQKASLAKSFGIDFDEFINELSGKRKTRKGGR